MITFDINFLIGPIIRVNYILCKYQREKENVYFSLIL